METQSPKYKVELLTLDDFPWCAEVAAVRMLTDEVKRPELINTPILYKIIKKMYEDKTAVVGWVNGERAGCLGGYLAPNLFNPDIATLSELVWWVDPKHRNSRIGAMLLQAYDLLSTTTPAHESTFSLLPSSPIKNSTLEKRGYKVEEQAFRKKLKE